MALLNPGRTDYNKNRFWQNQTGVTNPNTYGNTFDPSYQAHLRSTQQTKTKASPTYGNIYDPSYQAYQKGIQSEGSGGSAGGWNGGNITEDMLNQMESGPEYDRAYAAWKARKDAYGGQMSAIEEAMAAAEAARLGAYNTGKSSLNKASDEGLRSEYVRDRMARRDLPQLMAVNGGNGGLSETSVIDLNTNYGNNRADIENERQRGLADMASQYQSGQATDAAQWQTAIAQLRAQQADADLSYEMWAAEQAAANAQKLRTTTANDTSPEPILSLDEAMDLYSKGYQAENVLNALNYYIGSNWKDSFSAPSTDTEDTSQAQTSDVRNWAGNGGTYSNSTMRGALSNYRSSGKPLSQWMQDNEAYLRAANLYQWFQNYAPR